MRGTDRLSGTDRVAARTMTTLQCRCMAEKKLFRRELDSWRYTLIHCVGFESILEGIYGPLPRDLNLFHGGLLVVYALYHWLVTR
uniref:Uncharacterized protein n=1 Tax=Oreochromis niloticus TaxID=8128 RepID=A0A669CMC6_ORENI